MARYKAIDTSPRFLAVDLEKQLLPGSFEHAVHHLLEHEFDLSLFDTRYRNDQSGACAYPPGMLLKVILCAYAQGVVSSRGIERLCREHVTFIALSGDSAPHFTTLAAFVSSLDEEVAQLFAQVLYLCDRQGLIGREMFAIDGVKLPSNASKARSGTRADFAHQADKLEAAARKMLERHRANDSLPVEPDLAEKSRQKAESLGREAAELRQWLADHPKDRKGSKGAIRKSNRTDPDSAKMATGKGVIQGFTGVAAVDAKNQVIIEAQAHGTGSEQELLLPVVRATQAQATPDTLYTADAGYHSERNLKELAKENINALIADNGMRQRDERFKDLGKHKQKPDPLYDKAHPKKAAKRYRPQDFTLDPATGICSCPAGKQLYRNGTNCIHNGRLATKYSGTLRDCLPCEQRAKCLRTPEKTQVRQVAFFRGKANTTEESHTDRMKRAIDSEEGKARYGRRFATVEPVFGNLRHNKRLDRFTLRGRKKVDTQWKLYCLVHNIEKLAHHGFGQ
ncbi:transposase [Quatrionicoccus australiensis]|uniref:transposase n=1 Tax=Quatrionicoccus australiensis TaxID=138118 RepID=UPI001CF91A0F|nr:transposase [Quatrionicoccus australiensis]UCV14830.1 transposase [Quatrionicoccus australiensis]